MGTASDHAGPAWYPAILTAAVLCALAGPAFAQGQGNSWSALPELPTPRRLLSAAAFDGKIYTFGGCGSPCFEPPVHTSTFEETLVEVYDPRNRPGTAHWETKKPIPAILFGAAAAPFKDRIYLFGGFVTGNATFSYDPENDAWRRRALMPTWRHGMAAVALGEKIYVLGGSTGAAATNALEAYVPENNRWEQLAPMPTARVFLAAAAVGGKIYAVGGAPDCCGKAVTNAVEVYDPETNRWSSAAPLPVALQVSAAAEVDEKIYVLGGFIPGAGAQSSAFEYDPVANSWRTLAAMPEPRDQAPAVVLEDQEEREIVHVLGGSVDCHCRALATHSAYTPPAPTPTRTADLRIEKEIRAGGVLPGQSVRFTITAVNAGPNPVSGALVRDALPEELTGATWTCVASPGSRCAPGPVAGAIADSVDLPVDGQVTYALTGVIDPAAVGTLTNTATVATPDGVTDPDLGNNTSTVSRTIGECLGIEKTDGRDTVAPGGGALYRITVRHDCPVAMPVTVTDDLSEAGLENVRWCRGPGCAPATPGDLLDDFELPPGGAVTYRVAGSVPCECGLRTVTNTACVELAGGSVFCASDTNRVVPEPGADLALALAGPESVAAGAPAIYTITVTNLGLCTARGVEIRGQLPADFEVVAISPPCAQGLALCEPGDVAPGSKVEVTATLEAPAVFAPPASVTITAAVESDCDPVTANDTASVKTVAGCVHDLAISKSNGVGVLASGDPVLYEIRVSNLGGCAIAGARVEDVFPPELEQTSWCRGVGCAPVQGGPLADTLDLPAHGEETYVVAALVSPMFAGTLSNTATVSPPEGTVDPVPGNNSATDTDEVQPPPGVTVLCKQVSGLFEGGMVTYTFVLWNGGPADQADNPGDEFVDTLPPGLTLTGAVADSGVTATFANTVTWNGAIPAGSMVTIEITAMIGLGTVGQTICNEAAVQFDADGDGVNESNRLSGSCCFRVLPMAAIPGLTGPGAAALVLLLALLALVRMRRGVAG